MRYRVLITPCGPLRLAIEPQGLAHVDFLDEHDATAPEGWQEDKQALAPFAEQFDAYFAGELQAFSLPLSLTGTPFQQQVWHSLATIAYGETISYGEQALRLGKARAVRAVGAANGRNPLPIVLPCHRVIGKSGQLTGYAGGLIRKRWLLDFEKANKIK